MTDCKRILLGDALRAGQLLKGDGLHFAEVAEEEALAAWRELRGWIEAGVESDAWGDQVGEG